MTKESFNDLANINSYIDSDRWLNVNRKYSSKDIQKLRTPFKTVSPISERGANKLWELLNKENQFISGLGASTAQQALQMYNLDYEFIYVSGWQVAAESNNGGNTYPDLSLYPSNSGPNFVEKINNTMLRKMVELKKHNIPPVVADAESGFGGVYNVFELTSQFINSGIAGLHFEDQLASEKKCGHMGGKVVIPTHEYINKLTSARLAADVLGSPIVLIARTDSLNAKLMTSDFDEKDQPYLSKKRSPDGYYPIKNNHEMAITKSLSYSEYADVVWCETNTPDLGFAKEFASEIRKNYPNKILAYNCSPSFNWTNKFTDQEIAEFQNNLSEFGYTLQFVSLAGFHSMASSMYELAKNYKGGNMKAIVDLQEHEINLSKDGYTAIKHQQEVGGDYFESIGEIVMGSKSELLSKKDSTEEEQF
jgi:isocitrate lyase